MRPFEPRKIILDQNVLKLFSCGVQTSGHRKIIFMGGSSLEHICTSNPRKKMSHDCLRGYGSLHDFAKEYNHICSASPTKKVTSRCRGAGVKNKIQAARPFLAEYLWMIFKGWPRRKHVASPGRSSIDRTWWDEFKNFVSTRAQIPKHVFMLKIHLSLQKSTTTYVQLHQPKKWLQK